MTIEKSEYSNPDDFHDDVLGAVERKNLRLSVIIGKHIEFCFFSDSDYISIVKSIVSEISDNSLRAILKKLDSAYQNELANQGFNKTNIRYF